MSESYKFLCKIISYMHVTRLSICNEFKLPGQVRFTVVDYSIPDTLNLIDPFIYKS